MNRRRTRNRPGHQRLTAEDRSVFKKEREALVGSLITQPGILCGALVKEHVKGSQYVVLLANGVETYVSHKKPRGAFSEAPTSLSASGWKLWAN